MYMTSERFKPVQRVAANKERKAATALGESLKQQQAAEQRLLELRQYRDEYLERLRNATGSGVNVTQLREYQAFLDKLENAIREQELAVERARAAVGNSKQTWQARYTKTRAMDSAVSRLRESERKAEDKKEQNATDEQVQRRR